MSRELDLLFKNQSSDLEPWIRGQIPKHFKRCSVAADEMRRLAILGGSKIKTYFNEDLYYCQAVIAGAILSGDYDKFTLVTPSQYGKAIADDTPVLTRDGWKNHGDLEVGDEVISPNGDFVKVTYVHPKCEMDREITLETGDTFICHHNHEWVVNGTKGRKRENCTRNVSVSTMEQRGLLLPDGHRKFTIPVKEPLKGEHKDLAVDPYTLGVWLGDGSTTKGQICSCKDDIAVLDKVRESYPEGMEWTHKDTGVITRSFKGLASDLGTYGFARQNRNTRAKAIPEEYLTASIEQRLQLLAGLIDTDGYQYAEDGRYYFTTADETLKDSFESLISTFGWKASTVEEKPKLSSSGICGKKPYWRTGFNVTMDIPCVLERKKPTRFIKQRATGIVDIKHISGVQGNCITVEGGVYCIGTHLVPTHNSWLMGMIALLRAFLGHKVYIAGGDSGTTSIIMQNVIFATQNVVPEVKAALLNKETQMDKLIVTLSKTRLAFPNGGFVEAITLGDTYKGLLGNKAIGRSGDFIVDEAALITGDALGELGRREFSSIEGNKYQSIMISNPHNPGKFYDDLTCENPKNGHFILWIDALTAVEEARWTKELVYNSEFNENKDKRTRYLLCNLPDMGDSMFEPISVYEKPFDSEYTQYFLGVDAAYKGKDNITLCLIAVDENAKIQVQDIRTVYKGEWVEGVTSERIIKDIANIVHKIGIPCVCVDIGFGVWLNEGLNKRGVNAKAVNFGSQPTPGRVRAKNYAAEYAVNKRAEMHLDLKNLIETGTISFSPEVAEKLKDILPFVTSKMNTNGRWQVIPKTEIKAMLGKSPDELDSVLLAIHAMIMFTALPYC